MNPLLILGIQAVLTLGIGRSGGARHTFPDMVPRRGTVGLARRDMELSLLSTKSVTPTVKARGELLATGVAT